MTPSPESPAAPGRMERKINYISQRWKNFTFWDIKKQLTVREAIKMNKHLFNISAKISWGSFDTFRDT